MQVPCIGIAAFENLEEGAAMATGRLGSVHSYGRGSAIKVSSREDSFFEPSIQATGTTTSVTATKKAPTPEL